MPESKSGASRIVVLDTLRGVAAVGVAYFYHWVWVFGSLEAADRSMFPGAGWAIFDWLYNYGYLMVELFFVISGFIFVHVYFEKIRSGSVSWLTYMKLRVARLWPMFVFSSLVVFSLQIYRILFGMGVFYPEIPFKISDVILSLGFLQSGIFNSLFAMNAPLWSVCVEMVMYIVFFYTVMLSKNKDWSYIGLFIGLMVAGVGIVAIKADYLLFNPLISRGLVGFFSGSLTYFAYRNLGKVLENPVKARLNFVLILVLSLLLFSLLWIELGSGVFGNLNMIYSIFVFPVLILLILYSKLLNMLASLKPFRVLGNMSYSIYIMSFPVVILLNTLVESLGLNLDFYSRKVFLSYMLVGLLVSYLVHILFEKPSHAAMKRVLKV